MAKRCPLCQGKLKNGECLSCGYRLPDEEDISALYNYDPSDYPQPEPEEDHIREIIPDVQMEEIYPNRPDPIDIKVRDSQGKTVGQYGQNAGNYQNGNSPYEQQKPKGYFRTGRNGSGNSPYGQQGQYGGNQGNPYYQSGNSPYGQQGQYGQNRNGQGNPYYQSGNSPYGQQGQYGGNQGNPYYQSGNSPYHQKGNYNGAGQNKNQPIDNFKDLMKTYWWLILPFFLTPFCILIWYLVIKNDTGKKYYWIFILLTLIGLYIHIRILT